MAMELSHVVACVFLLASATAAMGKDDPFPQELLTGKTIAVVSHYGLTSTMHNHVRESQFKTAAEAVLRASHQYTVVDDPGKADLVLLLVGGYSEGFLGKKSHMATGLVFSGTTKRSNGAPLWISIQTSGIRTHSAAAVVSKALLKEVDKALRRNPTPVQESAKDENDEAAGSQTEEESTETGELTSGPLPQAILDAKKVMVILRIDTVSGMKGERREKAAEKELNTWGRFKVVDKPSEADLLIVCARYLDSGLHSNTVFQNMLIFPLGNRVRDWGSLPLWTALAVDAPLFGPTAGKQQVRWLKKQMEQQASSLPVQSATH